MRRVLLASVVGAFACNAITGAGELTVGGAEAPCADCGDASVAESGAVDVTTDPTSEPAPEVPGGFLDTTFGSAGMTETALLTSLERVTVQPDGQIATIGATGDQLGVLRFLAGGTLDTTFHVDGRALVSQEDGAIAGAIVVDSQNRIYAAGHRHDIFDAGTDDDAFIIRFTSTGNPDTTFGSGGFALVTGENEFSGAVLSAGADFFLGGRINGDFGFWKISGAGVWDQTWATAGRARLNVNGIVRSAQLVPGGAAIVGVGNEFGNGTVFRVVKIATANGQPDMGFGTMGLATVSFGTLDDDAWAVAVQPDGKIVVVGETETGETAVTRRIAVARLDTTGALDPTFGTGGKVLLSFEQGITDLMDSEYHGRDVLIDANGRIIVVGFAHEHPTAGGDRNRAVLARLRPDGALDPLFGTGGRLTFSNTAVDYQAMGAALQADGKIVVCGDVVAANDVFVARVIP